MIGKERKKESRLYSIIASLSYKIVTVVRCCSISPYTNRQIMAVGRSVGRSVLPWCLGERVGGGGEGSYNTEADIYCVQFGHNKSVSSDDEK